MPNSLIYLLNLMKPTWKLMLLATFIGVGTILANVGLLATSAVLITKAALMPPILDLLTLIVGVRFFGLSRAVLRYSERMITHKITFDILTKLRLEYYNSLLPLVPGAINKESLAKLYKNIMTDVELLKNFYLRVMSAPLVAILVLLISSTFLWQFSKISVLILIISYTLAGAIMPIISRRLLRNILPQLSKNEARYNQLLADYAYGYAELLIYGSADEEMQKIKNCRAGIFKLEKQKNRIETLLTTVITYIANLAMLIALALLIPDVIAGNLAGIYLVMVALVVLTSFEAINPIPQAAAFLGESLGVVEEMQNIANLPTKERQSLNNKHTIENNYALTFQDVNFAYEAKNTIENINFKLEKGEWLTIIGKSGSGKTTIANLVQGFYLQNSGEITIAGQNINNFSQDDLSQKITVLSQNSYVFNATIFENLKLANLNATDEEIWQVLEEVGLLEKIKSLKEGLNTLILEHGANFSGGELRRILIARLLLQNREFIILDEPLRGLDNITARAIHQLLRQKCQGKTVLEITHTLQYIDDEDMNLILMDGKQISYDSWLNNRNTSEYCQNLLRQESMTF